LTVLVHTLLVLLGCGTPMIVQMMSPDWYQTGYSLIQISNALWTLVHVVDRSSLPIEAPILLTVVPLAALGVLLLNLPAVAREVRFVRTAKPERVAEEDAELAAKLAPPPQPTQISPWDFREPC
jgi:hypothetical protein